MHFATLDICQSMYNHALVNNDMGLLKLSLKIREAFANDIGLVKQTAPLRNCDLFRSMDEARQEFNKEMRSGRLGLVGLEEFPSWLFSIASAI